MSGMSVYATNAPKVASVNLQIPQEYPVYFYHERGTVCIWVVVKIMVPFWIPNIIRHLIFRVPKKGP